MIWTDKRCKQLDTLRQLLTEVSSLNHGSHVAERIIRCEELAAKLWSIDLDDGKEPFSFHQFLINLAAADRSSAALQPSAKEK